MRVHEGDLSGRGRRIAIVAGRFNDLVTTRLVDGALAALRRHGVADEDVEIAWVPGAFEIPLIAQRVARSGQFDAVICLGAVIRGETAHFEHVAGQAAAGIQRVALDSGLPCVFGVLTSETLEQAMDRAGGKHGNKGWEAATAALETAGLLDSLPKEEG